MREELFFLRAFLERPFATGAIAPSSRSLAARMVSDMGLRDAATVVELGPGTGSFTLAILEELPRDALLLALELNPRLAAHLRARLPPRVRIVNASCEHLGQHLAAHGRPSADCILSGLPWAGFSRQDQQRLMDAVLAALRPGGRFATFAYVHAAGLPPGRRLASMLRASFRRVERSPIVWRNLPPAFVYRCEK